MAQPNSISENEPYKPLDRFELNVAQVSVRAFGEKEPLPSVEFTLGHYLETSYRCASFSGKEDDLANYLYRAIFRKDTKVVDIALWILVSHRVRRTAFKPDDHGRMKYYCDEKGVAVPFSKAPLVSLKDLLGGNLETESQSKVAKVSEVESFIRSNKFPSFKCLTIALSLFLAGYGARGKESRKNQALDSRWLNNLRGVSGYTGTFPPWFSVQFLEQYKLSPPQTKLAAALGAFLSASSLEDELPGAVAYGIVRPLCNLHVPIHRRVSEFEKRFPGKLVSDPSLQAMTNLGATIEASVKLGSELASARDEGAEAEVLLSSIIQPGMHSYLTDPHVRKGQVTMLYGVCEDDEMRGRENWKQYISNPWVRDYIDTTELMSMKAWVREIKSERIREVETLTGLTLLPLEEDFPAKKSQGGAA